MKYRKIFKWELFAGIAVILLINVIILNYFATSIYKDILDIETNQRLDIVGERISKSIDPLVFLLTPDDKDSKFYKDYLGILSEVREKWKMDITFINKSGKPCVSTKNMHLINEYLVEGDSNYSVTYFENGQPAKSYVYAYKKDDVLMGYILMELGGDALPAFDKIRSMQFNIMLILVILALIVSFAFSYFMTRRIEETVIEMESISRGNLDRKIDVKWNDEFSYLQEQINSMVSNLKEIQEVRAKEIQIVAMGLAHEIKNPAAAILNLAELAERGSDPEKVRERLGKIKSEVIRLNNITDKFIHFAKAEDVQKEKTPISKFYGLIKEQYKDVITDPGNMKENDTIPIDIVLMERAFKNLIKNAYEAGAVVVKVSAVKEKDFIVFTVSDNAPLIPDDISDKIFMSFYTTKSTGMGIGLAITRNIIDKHNGRIEYKQIGGNNTFEVILPLKDIKIEEE